MTQEEITLKIIDLIISGSVPILIFVVGVILTKKIENIKAGSEKRHYWGNKLADTFYEKFKTYTEDVAEFLAKIELLRLKVNAKAENDEEGTQLQLEINQITRKIFKGGIELKIYTNNLFGENNEVTSSTEKVYCMISGFINSKGGNILDIFDELKKLNSITEKVFNKKQEQ